MTHIHKIIVWNLLFIISGIFLVKCTSIEDSNENSSEIPQISELQVGETLDIDYSLLSDISLSPGTSEEIWKAPRKILGFIDGGCSMCSYRLSKWKKFVESTAKELQVPVIIIGTGDSAEDLKYIAHDDQNYDYPLFYDATDHIKKNNHIIDHPDYHGLLLDSENKVLIIGNPTEYDDYLAYYKKTLIQ